MSEDLVDGCLYLFRRCGRSPPTSSRQKLKGRKRYPLVLMLEPLFRCNLACAGCGKIQYPAHVLKKHLTPEQCFNAVEECGAPMVSIPGGEPLMHPQIDEIVDGPGRAQEIHLPLHQRAAAQGKLDLFTPSKYLTFSVHMDGQKEHHDFAVCREGTLRHRRGGHPGSGQARLPRHHQHHALRRRRPARASAQFFDEMMDLGVEGMMLSPGYTYDKAPDQEHFLSRKQDRQLFSQILSNRKRTGGST